ncbi:MAG: CvpA family protein [Ignavibacteriales bacterium]|nr:CvpA family protein [Ignavibacteriales bacterium]
MNYIDYIIIAFLVIGFILGFKDGMVRKLIGLSGILIGIFLAVKFSEPVGKLLSPFFNNEPYLAGIIGAFVIFIITIIAASVIKRLVHPHDKVNQLVNQISGGIIGTVQIVFFLSVLLLLLGVFTFPKTKTAEASWLYKPVYNVVPSTIGFLIGGKDFVKEFIESKDIDTSANNKQKNKSSDKQKNNQPVKQIEKKKK